MDERKEKIKDFVNYWKEKPSKADSSEKGDTQTFWLDLLTRVLNVPDAYKRIEFEKPVKIKENNEYLTGYIDAYIPETKILIEQKDSHNNLNTARKDKRTGQKLTPFNQAYRYAKNLRHDENPRFIITCNFKEFEVHDNNTDDPENNFYVVKLEDLERDYTRLQFLVNPTQVHLEREKEISIQAGRLVGKIYNALLKQYEDPTNKESLESLNILIVRLVFLLYAEDAGILEKQQFLNYMESYRDSPNVFRNALLKLFNVLDTPEDKRDINIIKYEPELNSFPYVNGGLFNKKKKIEIPTFNDEIINLIIKEGSIGFDWEGISPTIFGAVFESTLNPETRRSGGMHYTSLENIHKVIDPLFLNELTLDLERIKAQENKSARTMLINNFRDKLANLKFLDPACGSGNFLTETYICLRRLENEALRLFFSGKQVSIFDFDEIKVSIDQFYGIEINDFAVEVANTALFISEYQMLKETESIVKKHIDYLPLKSFTGIHLGNALKLDWNEVLPADECSYIMGNPPYSGARVMSRKMKNELTKLFDKKRFTRVGDLDYVAGWFKLAADYMKDTSIKAAFVSTNSVAQGLQATVLWYPLFEYYHLQIDFAYQSFIWDSESLDKARVACVIIGFSFKRNRKPKMLFKTNKIQSVSKINNYLEEGDNFFVFPTRKPFDDRPLMHSGSQPIDDQNLLLEPQEKEKILKQHPELNKYIKEYMMGTEFNLNKPRYCLWFEDATPHQLNTLPRSIRKRIDNVREFRAGKSRPRTKRTASVPHLFSYIHQPPGDYIAFNRYSKEYKTYIPMGILSHDVIAGDDLTVVDTDSLYILGLLMSRLHHIWTFFVSGGYGDGVRYSTELVYYNFPFPNPTKEQKERIEKAVQKILDIRDQYPDSNLLDFYNNVTFLKELKEAHEENNKAVMEAYGFDLNMSEKDIIEELKKLNLKLVKNRK